MLDLIKNAYSGYAGYLWKELTFQISPWWHNYFFWLMLLSAFFFVLEILRPWRTEQPRFRKDFWLDFFYMFFNFFIFSLIIFNAASTVVVTAFNDAIIGISGFDLQASNPMQQIPFWAILVIGFIISDFIQWNIHRLLHYVPWLWNFHKVHHSIEQMGFAGHLRYHWMENVVYKTIQYIPLALLGIGLYDFFIIHIFSLAVGHYNHSNIHIREWIKGLVIGGLIGAFVGWTILALAWPLALLAVSIGAIIGYLAHPIIKYIFNSPEMHLYHHAYDLPEGHRYGINFGLTLSVWDYIFGSSHVPEEGGQIKLGFPGVEDFPDDFVGQQTYGVTHK